MKYLLLPALLLLSGFNCRANTIDALKTDTDVCRFMISIDSVLHQRAKEGAHFGLLSAGDLSDPIARKLHIRSWEKADLNGDGRTDLVVQGTYVSYAVIDKGNNTFKVIDLKLMLAAPLLKPIHIKRKAYLLAYHKVPSYDQKSSNFKDIKLIDTLVYQYGFFTELNRHPGTMDLASVTFSISGCALGQCPNLKITVKLDGIAKYVAGTWNPRQGIFTTTLSGQDLQQVLGFINYMNVKQMLNSYMTPGVMDGGGWALSVTFKNGYTKNITDFNEGGTFGLESVYDLFMGMRDQAHWQSVK